MLSLSPIIYDGRKVLIAGAAHDLSGLKLQQATIQQGYTDLQVLHRQLEELNEQLELKGGRTHPYHPGCQPETGRTEQAITGTLIN